MKTPRYVSRTLAAGGFTSVTVPGRYLTVSSISASTFLVGFDGETPEQVIPGGRTYVERGFRLLRIQNTGGAAGTIVFVVSEDEYSLVDAANAAVLAAIAASLVGIDADTNRLLGVAAATQLADTLLAATGGLGTSLFAANAARRIVEVQALESNTGLVYVGRTNAVAAADKMAVLPAGASWYDEYYTGAVFAVGNDAAQSVCGYEL